MFIINKTLKKLFNLKFIKIYIQSTIFYFL